MNQMFHFFSNKQNANVRLGKDPLRWWKKYSLSFTCGYLEVVECHKWRTYKTGLEVERFFSHRSNEGSKDRSFSLDRAFYQYIICHFISLSTMQSSTAFCCFVHVNNTMRKNDTIGCVLNLLVTGIIFGHCCFFVSLGWLIPNWSAHPRQLAWNIINKVIT